MNKKVSAKLLILMAGILLLAHAVIPHLHFKAEIIIIGESDLSHAEHNHNPSNPGDQCHSNGEYCILKQVFLVRSENLTPNYFHLLTQNQPDDVQGFLAINSTFEFNYTAPPKTSPPDWETSKLYSYYYSGSTNSRGSPSV